MSLSTLSGWFPQELFSSEVISLLWLDLQHLAKSIITFQWLQNLITNFPILGPYVSQSVLKEHLLLFDPLAHTFSFLENSSLMSNRFLLGFANSLFLCLPFSLSQFISLRRLAINGIPAGVTTGLGTVVGQSLFFTTIFVGGRSLAIPWLIFEPFWSIFGIWWGWTVCFNMAHQRRLSPFLASEKSVLFQMFCSNLVLALLEQGSVFQYLSTITLGGEPTLLETSFKVSPIPYLTGLIFGNLFFSFFYGLIFLKLRDWGLSRFSIRYSSWIQKSNRLFQVIVLSLVCTPLFYYGLDTKIANPLGFVPQDQKIMKSMFYPQDWHDNHHPLTSKIRVEIEKDWLPYDQGLYLRPTLQELSIEDLNFQGERFWLGQAELNIIDWIDPRVTTKGSDLIKKLLENNIFSKSVWKKQQFLKQQGYFFEQTQSRRSLASLFFKLYRNESFYLNKNLQQIVTTGKIKEKLLQKLISLRREGVYKTAYLCCTHRYKKPNSRNFFPLNKNKITDIISPFSQPQLPYRKFDRFFQFCRQQSHPDSPSNLTPADQEILKSISSEIIIASESPEGISDLFNPLTPEIKDGVVRSYVLNCFGDTTNQSQAKYGLDQNNVTSQVVRPLILKKMHNFKRRAILFFSYFKMPMYRIRRLDWVKKRAEIASRLKKLYYCNPLFKLFLFFDINTFVERELASHSLTQMEEGLLFERRLALASYFHSLRFYSYLNTRHVDRTKGQANKSYNHQFKGTLPTTRRLFDITQDLRRNPQGRTVLKYDKPLFTGFSTKK